MFTDFFNQDNEEYAEALATDLKMVLKYSQDYEAVALLATRKVTKLILRDRLRCPATKFDLFTVREYLAASFSMMMMMMMSLSSSSSSLSSSL